MYRCGAFIDLTLQATGIFYSSLMKMWYFKIIFLVYYCCLWKKCNAWGKNARAVMNNSCGIRKVSRRTLITHIVWWLRFCFNIISLHLCIISSNVFFRMSSPSLTWFRSSLDSRHLKLILLISHSSATGT